MNKQMFSEYFANKRKSLNLSLNNVAEKLSLTIPAIYKYEKGNSYPDLTILADIANLFEVDLDSLLSCGNTKNNNYCEEFKFDIEKFAAYFSFLRKYNNLTLNELAKKIDVQYQTISKWEKGESLPNIEKFILVANIFNVSYSDLYFAFGINKEKQLKGTKKMPTTPIVFTSVGLLLMIIFICIFIIKNDKPKDIKYLYKPCDETIKLENIFFEPFAPSQE